ncbi:MAG: hypothetical protein SFV81_24520 [Pirellulaceae bacterium]|nr:hypothetical protein [Pirellulaceae bacterium]
MKKTLRNALKTIAALSLAFIGSQALAAGNVAVSVVNDELRIVGDSSANDIKVEQTVANRYRVTGLAGTKINGRNSDVFRVKKGIRADLKNGNDTLRIQGFLGILSDNIDGPLTVDMGLGSDNVILDFLVINGRTIINMGDGTTDTVRVTGVVASESSFSVVTGNGKDNVALSLANIEGGLDIFTQDGDDKVDMFSVEADFISLETGKGQDLINTELVASLSNWEIDAGSEDDTLELTNCSATESLIIATREGDDEVSITKFEGEALIALMGDDDDLLALEDVTFGEASVDGEDDDNLLVQEGEIDINDFVVENFDE